MALCLLSRSSLTTSRTEAAGGAMEIAVLPALSTDADFAAGKAGDGMKYKVMIVEDQTMPRELF